MRAPFPWFGGKSKVSPLVWERFGDVANYVEPFAGSLAVLLGRPPHSGTETVNDRDAYIANFWRSLSCDPDGVAKWADWPVSEVDLHARHAWLIQKKDFALRMAGDPNLYDCRIAGWWVWGLNQWIGGGWCRLPHKRRPVIGTAGRGFPVTGGSGVQVREFFQSLAERLRNVRVCCGDWERVLTPTCTSAIGVTGVLLDPPYAAEADRAADLYGIEDYGVSHVVREWAIRNGDKPSLRIALCGYEGEHEMPSSWRCIPWKAQGGMGVQHKGTRGNENANRERIWFSPHCLEREQVGLF